MTGLTDKQLVLLSRAAQRDDGAVEFPEGLKGAAATKTVAALTRAKLLREMRARPGTPAWRRDAAGQAFALLITRAGREAIGVDGAGEVAGQEAADATSTPNPTANGDGGVPFRPGTKLALVVGLLERREGASLEVLIDATGWLPHTTRAALTAVRRRGFTVERRSEGGSTVYSIPAASQESAAAAKTRRRAAGRS